MNTKVLTGNRKLLAVMLGVALCATVGASLAYAQTAGTTPGQGSQTNTPPQIQGSINLGQTILSSVQTKFSAAADTAASQVTNGKVIGGSLTVMQGYVVYSFKVIDDKSMVYTVIVDPANGNVLYTSQGHAFQLGSFGGMNHFGAMKHRFHMGGPMGNSQQPPSSGNTTPSSGSQE
jgi:uncharacterized membrane protein YkoI